MLGLTRFLRTREVLVYVLNVVDLSSEGIVDVDADNLPVSLALVDHGVGAQNLGHDNLTSVVLDGGDLNSIQRIVVTVGLCVRVLDGGVLPSLRLSPIVEGIFVMNIAELAVLWRKTG